MTITYKVLGQNSPDADTVTTLYTVPANTQAVISTLSIANGTGTNVAISVAIRPAGETLSTKHYIANETTLTSKDAMYLTLGVSLAATDVISIKSSAANVAFNVFGSEITS